MNKEFDDYDKLFTFLDESLNDSLKDIAEIFRQVLREFVKEKFYDIYTPKMYQRTWEVLNSISVSPLYKEADITVIDVFFDINKIEPSHSTFYVPDNLPRLHHHMDINGSPTNDIIVFLLNDGWKMVNGQKIQGGKFLQAMDIWVKNRDAWLPDLQRMLKNKGITIEIK